MQMQASIEKISQTFTATVCLENDWPDALGASEIVFMSSETLSLASFCSCYRLQVKVPPKPCTECCVYTSIWGGFR